MVTGVIFDMDGLMFDTERIAMEAWSECLNQAGYRFTEEEGRAIRGQNTVGIHNTLHSFYGPDIDCPLLHAQVRENMEKRFLHAPAPVKKGLYELIDWLQKNKIPMAVASSSRRATVEQRCREAKILDKFDAIVCGDMVEHSKPNPDIFLKAASMLHSNPAQTIVLEDSFNGVRAGNAGGFITIMVPDMDQPTSEIKALYTAKASSLSEVCQRLENNEW